MSDTTADGLPFELPGRYQVERLLGKGATATTWLATDTEAKGQVAIKVLDYQRVDSWKHVELFEREAKALAALDHPAIPTLRDFFEVEADEAVHLVVVQDFIAGTPLSETIAAGGTLEPEAVDMLARGLLTVLGYLHSQSPPVIHRDIKPSNVMLQPSGEPVLIDFGGVCFGWREPGDGSTFVATHGYAPPEQYMGQVSPRSDLYAVGATLLHALTGRRPSDFSFDTGRIEVPEDLAVDPGLRRLVAACLSTAPKDRPATAAAAQALLDGEAPTGGALVPASTTVPSQLTLAESLGPIPRDQSEEFLPVLEELTRTPVSGGHAWNSAGAALASGLGLLMASGMMDFTQPLEHMGPWVIGLTGLGLFTLASTYLAARFALANLIHHQTAVPTIETLLREGTRTRGIVTDTTAGRFGHVYVVSFEAHGEQQTLHQRVAVDSPSGHRFRAGDPVDVLFESGNPVRSRALLVKSSTAEALMDELGPTPRVLTSDNEALHELVVPEAEGWMVPKLAAEFVLSVGAWVCVLSPALGLAGLDWFTLLAAAGGSTVGMLAGGLRGVRALRRRALHEALFRDGRVTTGVVLKTGFQKQKTSREGALASKGKWASSVTYRFEVEGEMSLGLTAPYTGVGWWLLRSADRQRRRALKALHAGDPVLVLYDPTDPSKNCCVPHPIVGPDRLDTTLITHRPD
jgi:serine/threonine protein kinase